MVSKQVILDATVLSNFAYIDEIDFLAGSFNNVETVGKVVGELEAGVADGYTFLNRAVNAMDETIGVGGVTPTLVENTLGDHRLDPGEAHALTYSIRTIPGVERMFASDDHDARAIARQRKIPLTGSVGILEKGVVDGAFSLEQADEWLDIWIKEAGYFSPVDSVAEVLPDDYDVRD